MPKEVIVTFSYTKHEFLVRLFEDGRLRNWHIVNDTKDVQNIIEGFYFRV